MGSTPTCSHLPEQLGAVNEIHPGNYVFYDRMQALLGSCSLSDCAATVLATVIGHYPATGRILIDAGALALSKGTTAILSLKFIFFFCRSGLHAH